MANSKIPAGQQPYDVWNGARIGALIGGIGGALVSVAVGSFWAVLGGAAIGAVAGYLYERRRIDRSR